MSSTATQFEPTAKSTVLSGLTLQNLTVDVLQRRNLQHLQDTAYWLLWKMQNWNQSSAVAAQVLRELADAITVVSAPSFGSTAETGPTSPSPKDSPSPTFVPREDAPADIPGAEWRLGDPDSAGQRHYGWHLP